MKERSGCRSLLPALTRSPVSAACPMQTCFTSIADATENCKERSCFSFLTRASMKLIFILGTSGTRWPAFLSIKVWHYAANLAVSLSKGLLFPPDLSLTLFWHVNMSSWLSAWCHATSDTSRLTLWLVMSKLPLSPPKLDSTFSDVFLDESYPISDYIPHSTLQIENNFCSGP